MLKNHSPQKLTLVCFLPRGSQGTEYRWWSAHTPYLYDSIYSMQSVTLAISTGTRNHIFSPGTGTPSSWTSPVLAWSHLIRCRHFPKALDSLLGFFKNQQIFYIPIPVLTLKLVSECKIEVSPCTRGSIDLPKLKERHNSLAHCFNHPGKEQDAKWVEIWKMINLELPQLAIEIEVALTDIYV